MSVVTIDIVISFINVSNIVIFESRGEKGRRGSWRWRALWAGSAVASDRLELLEWVFSLI